MNIRIQRRIISIYADVFFHKKNNYNCSYVKNNINKMTIVR